MKILFVSAIWGGGGPGGVVKDLYAYMEARGEECWFAYARRSVPDSVRSIRIGSTLTVAGHIVKALCLDSNGFHSAAATRRFIRAVGELKPDLINLHNIIGFSLHVGVLFEYLKRTGIPVVWTVHDCWPFTGHCTYFDDVGCDKWRDSCGGCPARMQYPHSLFFDFSRRNLQIKKRLFSNVGSLSLVTPSAWLAGIMRDSFLKSYPIRVINNGIDLEVFRPVDSDLRRRYGLENRTVVLGVAIVWALRKGLDAFVRLSDMLDPEKYRVVLIGITKHQKRRLPDRILALPRTRDAQELARWYSAADVFVNPTLADNYPTVNLEALACGTPVVTYDTGGSGEMIAPGSGTVVRKGDLHALRDAIESCTLKRSGFAADRSRLDKSVRFADYHELFKSCAENGGRGKGETPTR